MKKTIELTPKFTKWGFVINGTVNTAIGLNLVLQADTWLHWVTIGGIFLVLAGPILVIYAIILFNPNNKITPKVQLDEKGIYIKQDLHKRALKIDWSNIKEIAYKTFELDFLLNNHNTETVSLQTTAEISIEIKKAIRKLADGKQINIIGG